jgi:hypothetical protein
MGGGGPTSLNAQSPMPSDGSSLSSPGSSYNPWGQQEIIDPAIIAMLQGNPMLSYQGLAQRSGLGDFSQPTSLGFTGGFG